MNNVTTIKRVPKRQFLLHPNRYLEKGLFILTYHGKDVLEVDIRTPNTMSDKSINVTTIKNNVTTKYGCGCKKVDGKIMCPKHDRY